MLHSAVRCFTILIVLNAAKCPVWQILSKSAGLQAFDPSTGLPHKSVEMLSWPKVTRMSGGFFELLGKALLECVWATGTSEGISVLLDR